MEISLLKARICAYMYHHAIELISKITIQPEPYVEKGEGKKKKRYKKMFFFFFFSVHIISSFFILSHEKVFAKTLFRGIASQNPQS
jgi:hypothetical protein